MAIFDLYYGNKIWEKNYYKQAAEWKGNGTIIESDSRVIRK